MFKIESGDLLVLSSFLSVTWVSVTVDVITNESLGTGSEYGNTDLDGTMWGVGYNKSFDNTTFIRFEGNYMAFDGTSLSSADNKITLKNLDGVSGKVSLGKSF